MFLDMIMITDVGGLYIDLSYQAKDCSFASHREEKDGVMRDAASSPNGMHTPTWDSKLKNEATEATLS